MATRIVPSRNRPARHCDAGSPLAAATRPAPGEANYTQLAERLNALT